MSIRPAKRSLQLGTLDSRTWAVLVATVAAAVVVAVAAAEVVGAPDDDG